MTEQTQSRPRDLLLIAYFIFFAMAMPVGVLNVAWVAMQVTFSVSLDALGILLFANTCGSLLGAFFSGRLIGRYGLGRYLVTGGAIMACGLVGYVIAPTWIALIASAFVTTLGFSFYNAGLNIFVSSRYTAGQFNWLHACYGVGQTVAPTVATLIITRLGQSWHWAYVVVLAFSAVATLMILITRARWVMPSDGDRKPGAPGKPAGVFETLRIPIVLLGMALFFMTSGVIAGTGQLSNTLLTGRGVVDAGFWISFYWLSFTIGRIVMGFIAHRLDNTLLIRTSLIIAAFGTLLLWQTGSAALNLLGLAAIGLACAPIYPTLISETHRRVEARYRANAIGFEMAGAGLGQSIYPGLIALVAQHSSLGVIAPMLFVGALVAIAIHETTARRQARIARAAAA